MPTRVIRHRPMRKGFTLLELMVAIAILAIIATVGVPAFNNLARDSSVKAEANLLLNSIHLARSEAVKRGSAVWIAPLTSNDWSSGWEIRIDNGDNTFSATGDTLFKRFDPLKSSISNAPARLLLSAQGNLVSPTSTVAIKLKPNGCENNEQRQLNIELSGRASLQRISCSS